MSKLSQKQRDFLKTIENKKTRREQKIQFKLQNEYNNKLLSEGWIKMGNDNGKYIWHEHNIGISFQKMKNSLTKEKLNELTNPNSYGNADKFKAVVYSDVDDKAEEILPKNTNYEIPKEFCVEITKENYKVLTKILNSHNNSNVGYLIIGYFVNSKLDYCFDYSKSKNINTTIVSTEEFLRYIGKEDLIETPKNIKFPKGDNMNWEFQKSNSTISEITDKVVSLSLEKFDALKVNDIEVVSPIELSKKVNAQERNQELYNYLDNTFGVSATEDNLREIEDIVGDMIDNDSED